MSVERIIGEVSTDVKHILQKLESITEKQDRLEERVSVLETMKNYTLGALATFSIISAGLWTALQSKVGAIASMIIRS